MHGALAADPLPGLHRKSGVSASRCSVIESKSKETVVKMSSKAIVAVQGATGNVGGAVVKLLTTKYASSCGVVAGVRDVKKADRIARENVEVRKLDSDDSSAELQKSLSGVQRLLVIPPNAEDRQRTCLKLIDEAKKAGVQFVLLHSFTLAAHLYVPRLGFCGSGGDGSGVTTPTTTTAPVS